MPAPHPFLGPEAYVLFGGEHAVHNLTISGSHYGDIVSEREAPIAIDHDLNNGYVYWSDILKEKIERAYLQGDGSVETVVDKVKHSNGMLFVLTKLTVFILDSSVSSN